MARLLTGLLALVACSPVTKPDRRAFLAAAETGDARVVREELANGVLPDDVMNRGDRTALQMAAMSGRVEIVRILLEAGADPTVGEEGTNLATELRGFRAMLQNVHKDPELSGTYRQFDGRVIDLRTLVSREPEYAQIQVLIEGALAERARRQ